MKRVMWAGALPLVLVGSAAAGDWHTGTTLLCGNCHIMHYSESHGPVGTTPGPSPIQPGLMGGPNHYLLRAPINDLCLACHDGGVAADVLGSQTGTDVRLGGRLNRGAIGHPESGHTLDITINAPGSDPAWNNPDGLNCIDCHHQHGYAGPGGTSNYRNLKFNPGGSGNVQVTYETQGVGGVTTPTNTVDVYQRNSLSYDESDMDWQEPLTDKSKIAEWCGGCHDNFHGDPGTATGGGGGVGGVPSGSSWDEFERHPSSAVNIGALGGGHSSESQYLARVNRVKVMSSGGNWLAAAGSTPGDLTPTCISCHKAHGNQNDYGLIFRSGGGTLTEEGDTGAAGASPPFGQLEHLCGQCHVQASAFAL